MRHTSSALAFWLLVSACWAAPDLLSRHGHDPIKQPFPVLDVRQLAQNGTLGLSNDTNSTTAMECKTAPIELFYKHVQDNCDALIDTLQTCPQDALSRDQRIKLSDSVAACSLLQFQSTFPCVSDRKAPVPEGNITAGWQPPVSVTAGMDCQYPEYDPILEEASRYFVSHVDCCAKSSYTAEFQYSYTGQGAYSDTPGAVIQITPIQYQRCTLQRSASEVRDCVVSTVSRLRWVDRSMFLWGGQSAPCDGPVVLFIGIAFTMLIELLHMAADLWWYRRTGKSPRFSWVRLWWALVAAFGEPILKAYLLYRHSFGSSMMTLVRIFLLTPRIAPVIGVLSPLIAKSKSWGVQVLTVDTLLAISGLFTPFMFVKFGGGGVSASPVGGDGSDPDAPPGMSLIWIGSLLCLGPGIIVAALYMASGFVMWGLFIISCLIRKSKVFGWGLTILSFWLCLILMFAISPLFALWEVCWKAFCRDRQDEFPPLVWLESAMLDPKSFTARLLYGVGYWFWCAVQFVVFVGRWMVLTNILVAAGDAFCPVAVKEVAAESALLALGAALSSMGLRFSGLAY